MRILQWLFGGGRNVLKETVEVFRENAEAGAVRDADYSQAALAQYAAEFHARSNRTRFDSLADGLNRLVRPAVTLCVLLPIPITMIWPGHMAIAIASLALLPVGYWAIVGTVTSFYYGGRMQLKAQEFHTSLAATVANAPRIIETIDSLREFTSDSPGAADPGTDTELSEAATETSENPAVRAWQERGNE
ncbi:3TM-type holin [Halocynthiibacter styelae]|uniref:Carboxylesterase n=1 Tax=Halocynthiibacter styelae TaxID=2761955 RepID=A0A8J7LM39_9RHOB|nr:3TM-type holin [Paenihalocynthiibacter styelae]MBI1495384.1 carboxylesterase [Paenihalocynthiibacter styelae]